MSILPNPEEVLCNQLKVLTSSGLQMRSGEVLAAMKEYGRQVRDKTLRWALENARLGIDLDSSNSAGYIIKESILNGKTSKDLEI